MFKVGDIVKHKASFLKTVGMCTNVPKDGKVTAIRHTDGTRIAEFLEVEWCNRAGALVMVNACNVMLAKDPDYSGM